MTQPYGTLDVCSHPERDLESIRREFEWWLPEEYNIATETCECHVGSGTRALRYEDRDGNKLEYTFAELDSRATRLADYLDGNGVSVGDVVAIALSQRPETLVAHLAVYKSGAVAAPLPVSLGVERTHNRLNRIDADVLVTNDQMFERFEGDLPDLTCVLPIPSRYEEALAEGDPSFETVTTKPTDPAIILFTSGTSGRPKPAVHGHQCLAAAMPTFQLMNDCPGDGATIYTPESWSWVVGTLNTTFPAWREQLTVAGRQQTRFISEEFLAFLERQGVTHVLLTPTKIRILMDDVPRPCEQFDLDLEVIVVAGEPTTRDLFEWVDDAFEDVPLVEQYGQTEADLVAVNPPWSPPEKNGSLGKPVPGHMMGIIDADGNELEDGELGTIALLRPDPALFQEYYGTRRPDDEEFVGNWLDTGDVGFRDSDGYYWFVGRADSRFEGAESLLSLESLQSVVSDHPEVAEVTLEYTPQKNLKSKQGEEVITTVIWPESSVQSVGALKQEMRERMRDYFDKHRNPRRPELVARVVVNRALTTRRAKQPPPEGRSSTGDGAGHQ